MTFWHREYSELLSLTSFKAHTAFTHVAHHQKVVPLQPFRNIIILNSLSITIISKETIIGIKSSSFFFSNIWITLLYTPFFLVIICLKKQSPIVYLANIEKLKSSIKNNWEIFDMNFVNCCLLVFWRFVLLPLTLVLLLVAQVSKLVYKL